jgi:hypothetical protein
MEEEESFFGNFEEDLPSIEDGLKHPCSLLDLEPREIMTAIKVLTALANNMNIYKGSESIKPLRMAILPFIAEMKDSSYGGMGKEQHEKERDGKREKMRKAAQR